MEVRCQEPLVASLLRVVRPGAPSSFLFLVEMPFVPNSFLILDTNHQILPMTGVVISFPIVSWIVEIALS